MKRMLLASCSLLYKYEYSKSFSTGFRCLTHTHTQANTFKQQNKRREQQYPINILLCHVVYFIMCVCVKSKVFRVEFAYTIYKVCYIPYSIVFYFAIIYIALILFHTKVLKEEKETYRKWNFSIHVIPNKQIE